MNRIILYVTVFIFSASCREKLKLPDMRETYSSKDMKPFGGYMARRILENSFPENYIQTSKQPFGKAVSNFDDTSAVYFSAARNLFIEEKDVNALLDFIYNGNTVFFAAANIDSVLMKRLYCEVSPNNSFEYTPGNYEQTTVSLSEQILSPKESFGYFYRPAVSSFTGINDRYARIIGYNRNGDANCIVFFWGKGKLFLHCDPRMFSNYFLLKNDNYRYMETFMKILGQNPEHVYWDDYYSKKNRRRSESEGGGGLAEIFKYPSLGTAFWLLVLMLAMYILFGGKRRQRIIRQVKPNVNSSVAFTETIARLYLQKHDNKNIAEKMITYFHEFIRNNYFLNANAGSDEFIKTLSRKSGIPEENTTALFNTIAHANSAVKIDDYQLLSLNEQIQQFYKKRK